MVSLKTIDPCNVSIFIQAEFLHDVAMVLGSLTEIDHWWIGLTDIGKNEYVNSVFR
jgi:hypothetical protein